MELLSYFCKDLETASPERVFKVVFVGDSGVGKSSLIHRFCNNSFRATFSATIGKHRNCMFWISKFLLNLNTLSQYLCCPFCSRYHGLMICGIYHTFQVLMRYKHVQPHVIRLCNTNKRQLLCTVCSTTYL